MNLAFAVSVLELAARRKEASGTSPSAATAKWILLRHRTAPGTSLTLVPPSCNLLNGPLPAPKLRGADTEASSFRRHMRSAQYNFSDSNSVHPASRHTVMAHGTESSKVVPVDLGTAPTIRAEAEMATAESVYSKISLKSSPMHDSARVIGKTSLIQKETLFLVTVSRHRLGFLTFIPSRSDRLNIGRCA